MLQTTRIRASDFLYLARYTGNFLPTASLETFLKNSSSYHNLSVLIYMRTRWQALCQNPWGNSITWNICEYLRSFPYHNMHGLTATVDRFAFWLNWFFSIQGIVWYVFLSIDGWTTTSSPVIYHPSWQRFQISWSCKSWKHWPYDCLAINLVGIPACWIWAAHYADKMLISTNRCGNLKTREGLPIPSVQSWQRSWFHFSKLSYNNLTGVVPQFASSVNTL